MQRSTTMTRTIHSILFLAILAILASLTTPHRTAFAMPSVTMQGIVWMDTNCDGVRQTEEPGKWNFTVYLFAAGDDQQINTADDQVIEEWSTGTDGSYRFSYGITDLDYALVVLKKDQPADLFPGPLNAGSDRAVDNDMRADLWVTNGFRMSETETVTGIDIGLCQVQLTPRLYMPAIWR